MIAKLTFVVLAALAVGCIAEEGASNQVVCYYDSKGSFRTGEASFHPKYLADAAQHCTYLIYGYAAINKKNYCLEPLNPNFDVDQYKTYQEVTSLKTAYPHLRILLSVGGGRDIEHIEKYLYLLESPEKRHSFISSAIDLLKQHKFDGLDLAWQFPLTQPKVTNQGFWSSAWTTIKSPFVSTQPDPKAHEHKQQFAELVEELKKSCRNDGYTLSLSVLPNTNSSLFFDVPKLIPHLDFVNLWAFDYFTPERNPNEADLPAPLYEQVKRRFDENGEYLVDYWCHNGAPSNKVFLGIPTFARTWKTTKHDASCIPPLLDVHGPGLPGAHTKEAGLLSYAEIYPKLSRPITILGASTVVKEGFDSHKHATYALFESDEAKHRDTWAGFEDPDTVAYKATYARKRGLAGVAIVDLTLDDFKGVCDGIKYPLLRAALPHKGSGKTPFTTVPSINLDPVTTKPIENFVDPIHLRAQEAGPDVKPQQDAVLEPLTIRP